MIALLFELLGELGLEVLFELVAALFGGFLGGRRNPHSEGRRLPVWLVNLGLIFVGAALSWLVYLVLPERVLGEPQYPGLSLVLSPLLVGTVMAGLGRLKRSHGKRATAMATFWGGAGFAFGFALARFLLLKA